MHISTDELILWQYGFWKLNVTVFTTWILMIILTCVSYFITRRLKTDVSISRWQCVLEIIVVGIKKQMIDVGLKEPEKYIGFLGTLFIFIGFANLCTILPFYEPPTGSLSTTAALAACVFFAVPIFGITESGIGAYLKSYLKPTFIMLPFNVISELSRTLALAVRLFGNVMSGVMILAVLMSITPLIFPLVMSMLGLLTGMVQAYIFSILATVYIAAAVRVRQEQNMEKTKHMERFANG